MKVLRHARHADRVVRAGGTLAGGGGGVLLWSQAWHFGGYGFAAAFVRLAGVTAGVRALCNYNRWRRGAEGEDAALNILRSLPDSYACHGDTWFCVRPDGTRQSLRSSVSRQVKQGRKAAQRYLVDCDVPSAR